MDKNIFSTRQKLTSDDLNLILTDTENSDWATNKEVLFNTDTIQTGLTGTGSGINTVSITAGRAFDSTYGKRINVANGATLKWDGTNGAPALVSQNRLDLVSIKHTYLNGSTQPRQFIDVDPTSSTYGQAYTSNIVTNKTDYYEFVIISGTGVVENPATSVPITPSGTIPLFTVHVGSGTITNISTANIDNLLFDRYRSKNIQTLRDVTKTFVYDSGWTQVTWTTSGSTIATIQTGLKPVLEVGIRGGSSATNDLYYSNGYFTGSGPDGYTATYNPTNGNVAIINNTAANNRYARVILLDSLT